MTQGHSPGSRLRLLLWPLCVYAQRSVQTVVGEEGATAAPSFQRNPDHPDGPYTFAMISKSLDNPFFQFSQRACRERARTLPGGGTCLALAPDTEDAHAQARLVDEIVVAVTTDAGAGQGEDRTPITVVDAIAVAVIREDVVGPAIDRAVHAGIPVVTFDSDAPESRRLAYVGTDNYFFGSTLAKVVKQLRPSGGTFAVVSSATPNLNERVRGLLDELRRDAKWTHLPESPSNYEGNLSLVQEQLHAFARQDPTAIIPVSGAAMRSGGWEVFVEEHRFRNITLVSGDAMTNQLQLLDRGYVQGLVGQLPYEMGAKAIEALYEVIQGHPVETRVIGTNVLSHIFIPLKLPELVVDHNLIGNLHVIGHILFGLNFFMASLVAYWTFRHRHHTVVKTAQPTYLIMIIVGIVLMSASMIPLSFDDNGDFGYEGGLDGAMQCMSVPWLGFVGFTLTFSALFSKTMRVNRMYFAQASFRRLEVFGWKMGVPFVVLMGANLVLLMIWSIRDPLRYVRQDLLGTDGWNRVIATYGSCQSNNVKRFLIPIAAVNLGVLLLANWEAYFARNITAEFSEARYIGLAMMSLMQACGIGIPVLFVVRQSPQAFYLVLVFMIFVICAAVLMLIFVPKIILVLEYDNRNHPQQSRMVLESFALESSAQRSKRSSSSGKVSSLSGRHSSFRAAPENIQSQFVRVDSPSFTSDVTRFNNGTARTISEGSAEESRLPSRSRSTSLSGSSNSKKAAAFVVERDSMQDWALDSLSNPETGSNVLAQSGLQQNSTPPSMGSEDETTIDGVTTTSVLSDSEVTMRSSAVSLRSSAVSLRSSGVSLRSSGVSLRSSAASRSSASKSTSQNSGRIRADYMNDEGSGRSDHIDLPSLTSFTDLDEDFQDDLSRTTTEGEEEDGTDTLDLENKNRSPSPSNRDMLVESGTGESDHTGDNNLPTRDVASMAASRTQAIMPSSSTKPAVEMSDVEPGS